MKRFFAALLISAIIVGFSTVHAVKTLSLAQNILDAARVAEQNFRDENWDGVQSELAYIQEEWEKNHLWAYATLSTKQIDEIEISLTQSIAYSEIEAKNDFAGEFKMFCMLIEHLPKQEAFSFGELI